MDFRLVVTNLFYMRGRSAKTSQWCKGSYWCTLKKFAFYLDNWFSLSSITNPKGKLLIQLWWSPIDVKPVPIFFLVLKTKLSMSAAVLFQTVIPEDELGFCWYAGLLSALAGCSPCSPCIRSGVQGALWADSAHTNQGTQGKAQKRCTPLRSDLSHLSSACYIAPKGERKAEKMEESQEWGALWQWSLDYLNDPGGLCPRDTIFLADTGEHQSDRTPWQVPFS